MGFFVAMESVPFMACGMESSSAGERAAMAAARLSSLLKSWLTSARNCRWGPVFSGGDSVMMKMRAGISSSASNGTGSRDIPTQATSAGTDTDLPWGMAMPYFIPVDIFCSRSSTAFKAAGLSLMEPALSSRSSISLMMPCLSVDRNPMVTVSSVRMVLKLMGR